jgi:hypothetical protein
VTANPAPLPIDPGLLDRFLEAERGMSWQPVPGSTAAGSRALRSSRRPSQKKSPILVRLAYYHDETARIERRSEGSEAVLLVTSGPVGALVLIGESHRRGLPTTLEAREAKTLPGFPDGAIEARWKTNGSSPRHSLPFADVVQLARYALV